uniref:Uncharacterized protein n=2 Tax=Lygus hesperus TaxID=30085 RepID=A0A146M9I7_LYGHE
MAGTPDKETASPFPTHYWCNSPQVNRKSEKPAEPPPLVVVVQVENPPQRRKWNIYLTIIVVISIVFLMMFIARIIMEFVVGYNQMSDIKYPETSTGNPTR